MDDYDDFDEVFDEIYEDDEMLLDSQESLTDAAANPMFDSDGDDIVIDPSTPATSENSQHAQQHNVETNDVLNSSHSGSSEDCTALEQIEAIFDKITETLDDQDDELQIQLRIRPKPSSLNGQAPSSASSKFKAIRFPGKTANEAWRFSTCIDTIDFED